MTKSIILLDGGMGQELIRRSGKAPTPLWATGILLDNPELVEDLHTDFIEAGAKVISLNNYTATPARLSRDASMDLFEPIHKAAQDVAHAARRKSGRQDVKISGCLGPIMASYKPELVPAHETCLAQYRDLVAIQKDAVDAMFCETMSTIREAVCAATASCEAGIKTYVSFTLDDESPAQLRSGETLSSAIAAIKPFDIAGIMVNCSMPETVSAVMPQFVKEYPVVGGYANGFQSVTPLKAGGTVSGLKAREDLTPAAYAAYALSWADAGAKIIGGCCEVGPDHIAQIYQTLIRAGYKITSV